MKGGDVNLGEAGRGQDALDVPRVGKCKWAWRTRLWCRRGHLQQRTRRRERDGTPGILLEALPANEREPPALIEPTPQVPKSRHRIGEEHDAKTREQRVERPRKIVRGGVILDEGHVGQVLRPLPRPAEQWTRGVDADHLTRPLQTPRD